jgi:hypothetical protein
MSLLDLPATCLLAVLQCCTAGPHRSLFNIGRAHSRLHQAATEALRSIRAAVCHNQQRDSAMLYLVRHGRHIDSVTVSGQSLVPSVLSVFSVSLCQLPPDLQLSSLQLSNLTVQLLPGNGAQGVLQAAAANTPHLKQLRLQRCALLDGGNSLATALVQLPGLEHLSLMASQVGCAGIRSTSPGGALQQLVQLTYLKIFDSELQDSNEAGLALQPLQAMHQLADLRLICSRCSVTSSMLCGACHLTRLELGGGAFDSGALAGKTKLQHLELDWCWLSGGAAVVAALLSQMQHLQQLTHLDLYYTLRSQHATTPAAAYSALTASSKLQYLRLCECTLPAGVWQQMFPAGRQLPHLQSINLSEVMQPGGDYAPIPEGSCLGSCCPGLRYLDATWLTGTEEQLRSLRDAVPGVRVEWP